MTFPAYGVIRFVAADLDLLARIDGFPVLDAEIHRRFALAEPADRLHFLDFIRVNKQKPAALEQLILEIVLEAEGHNRNIQLIHDPDKLLDVILVQKLALVHKYAVGPWLLAADHAEDIGVVLNWDRWPAQANPRGDIAGLVPVVESRSEEHDRFVLLLVIMRHFENLNGFAAVHRPVFKK